MLEIEFIFKVTDHPGNTDGSVQTITFDLISDSGVVITVTGDVTVSVLGSEMATIQLDTWCDDTFSYPAMSGYELYKHRYYFFPVIRRYNNQLLNMTSNTSSN